MIIDTHCHILPAVDDGADSLQTARMMAAMAADDGVRAIIATPHITWTDASLDRELARMQRAAEEFRATLEESGIPIACHLGSEVLFTDVPNEDACKKQFPRIEKTDYALVEFIFTESLEKMNACFEVLSRVGVHPIIAHPERYTMVQKNKTVMQDWVNKGYYLQLDKGSILGQFGRKEKSVAEWMLKMRLAAVVGTDAHSTGGRSTRVSDMLHVLIKRCGAEYTELLSEENPMRILQNKPLRYMK